MASLRERGGVFYAQYYIGGKKTSPRSREAGFATHLVKPVTLRALRDAIASQIE